MTFLVLTALLLLAMIGGVAGILLERRRDMARAAWRNPVGGALPKPGVARAIKGAGRPNLMAPAR